MAYLSGINSKAALRLNAAAVAWGTAGSVSTGDTCAATYTPNNTVQELMSSPIGSARQMATDAEAGTVDYGLTLAGEATFQSGLDRILAQFFGTSGAPTEVTAAQGDYRHRMTLNSTWNANRCTYVAQVSDATVHEYASVVFSSLTLTSASPKTFLNFSATGVANNVLFSGTTNSFANVTSTTIADSEYIKVAASDNFWINAQGGGALAGGDLLAITDYQIVINKPQSTPKEIKGSAGVNAPVVDNMIDATVTVTVRGNTDNTYHTAWSVGTEYKSLFRTVGTVIASGTNKSLTVYAPRMKLIEMPGYSITDPGTNPLTLVFKVMAASANPTGMDSTLPYVELVNARSGAYIS
jgi:hypothetical protein